MLLADHNAEGFGGQHLKTLTWLTIIAWIVYPILWIVGSEGTAALGLSQQVDPHALATCSRRQNQSSSPAVARAMLLARCLMD